MKIDDIILKTDLLEILSFDRNNLFKIYRNEKFRYDFREHSFWQDLRSCSLRGGFEDNEVSWIRVLEFEISTILLENI